MTKNSDCSPALCTLKRSFETKVTFYDLQTTGQFWTHEGYLSYSAAECNLPPTVKRLNLSKQQKFYLFEEIWMYMHVYPQVPYTELLFFLI